MFAILRKLDDIAQSRVYDHLPARVISSCDCFVALVMPGVPGSLDAVRRRDAGKRLRLGRRSWSQCLHRFLGNRFVAEQES